MTPSAVSRAAGPVASRKWRALALGRPRVDRDEHRTRQPDAEHRRDRARAVRQLHRHRLARPRPPPPAARPRRPGPRPGPRPRSASRARRAGAARRPRRDDRPATPRESTPLTWPFSLSPVPTASRSGRGEPPCPGNASADRLGCEGSCVGDPGLGPPSFHHRLTTLSIILRACAGGPCALAAG